MQYLSLIEVTLMQLQKKVANKENIMIRLIKNKNIVIRHIMSESKETGFSHTTMHHQLCA